MASLWIPSLEIPGRTVIPEGVFGHSEPWIIQVYAIHEPDEALMMRGASVDAVLPLRAGSSRGAFCWSLNPAGESDRNPVAGPLTPTLGLALRRWKRRLPRTISLLCYPALSPPCFLRRGRCLFLAEVGACEGSLCSCSVSPVVAAVAVAVDSASCSTGDSSW